MKKDLVFEKGQHYIIEITDQIDDFLISYEAIWFDNIPLKATNIKSVLERIKKVAEELNVKPSEFIVELFQDGLGPASCVVDKNDALLLELPVNIINKKIMISDMGIHEDYLLYHELMHAKEVLDRRFPPSGILVLPKDLILYLVGKLGDFSNEGKLEDVNKPHLSKEESIENVYACLLEDFHMGLIDGNIMKLLSKKVIAELCELTWGKELTQHEICTLVKRALGKT